MTDLATTIDTYLSAYNELDGATRLTLIETAFAEDAHLVDPPLAAQGRQGISDMMDAVHQQFPGHTFRRATGVDEHHGYFRYGWELLDPAGAVVLAGVDVGALGPASQLVRVIGFFGPLPEVA